MNIRTGMYIYSGMGDFRSDHFRQMQEGTGGLRRREEGADGKGNLAECFYGCHGDELASND